MTAAFAITFFAAHAATQTFTITDDSGASQTVTFRTNGHAIERLDSQHGFVSIPLHETPSPQSARTCGRVAAIEHLKTVMLPGFTTAGGSLSNIVNELNAAIRAADTSTNTPMPLLFRPARRSVHHGERPLQDLYLPPFTYSGITAYNAIRFLNSFEVRTSLSSPPSPDHGHFIQFESAPWLGATIIKPYGGEDFVEFPTAITSLPSDFFERFPDKNAFLAYVETKMGSTQGFAFTALPQIYKMRYDFNGLGAPQYGFTEEDSIFYFEALVMEPLLAEDRLRRPFTLFAIPDSNATSLWARAHSPDYSFTDLYHYTGDAFTRIAFDTKTGDIAVSNAMPFVVSTGGGSGAKLWFCLNPYTGDLYRKAGSIFEKMDIPDPPPAPETSMSQAIESLRRVKFPEFVSTPNEHFTNVLARFRAALREASPDCPVIVSFDLARAQANQHPDRPLRLDNFGSFGWRKVDAYDVLKSLASFAGLSLCCNGPNIGLLDRDTYMRQRTPPVKYTLPEQARPGMTLDILESYFPLPKAPPAHDLSEMSGFFDTIGVDTYDPQSGTLTLFATDESCLLTVERFFDRFRFPRYTASVRAGTSGTEITVTDTATGSAYNIPSL